MKHKTSLAAFAAALVLFPTVASADHHTFHTGYNGPWEWNELSMTTRTEDTSGDGIHISTYYKGTAEISGYNGDKTDLAIPDKIFWQHDLTGPDLSTHFEYEVEVVAIGASAFENSVGLTSVTIPNSVTNIGYSAFRNSTGLSDVSLSDNCDSIGDFAFASCTNLVSVNLGNGIRHIGSYAFAGCKTLRHFVIPKSVETIGDSLLQGCRDLQTLALPFIGPSRVFSTRDHQDNGARFLFGYRIGMAIAKPQPFVDSEDADFYDKSVGRATATNGGTIDIYVKVPRIQRLTITEPCQTWTYLVLPSLKEVEFQGREYSGPSLRLGDNSCTSLTNVIFQDGMESIAIAGF